MCDVIALMVGSVSGEAVRTGESGSCDEIMT